MQRFRLKQWRETFEEVIIEAETLGEAEEMADGYPEYIGCATEVVKEVESKLRTEVEAIETTSWLAHFDDPENEHSAESEQFETEDHTDEITSAKDKAIEWLQIKLPSQYPYLDIPEFTGDWEASRAGGTDTLILWRELANNATLTLVEIFEPRG